MTDPAIRAADSLGEAITAYQALLTDDGYRAVEPAFRRLADALPEPLDVPTPRRSATQLDPMDAPEVTR